VSEKRRRWVLNLILVISTVSLVGVSVFPLLTTNFAAKQPPQKDVPAQTASPAQTADPQQQNAKRKADLEAQVKGYESVLKREPDNTTALQGVLEARLQLMSEFQQGDMKAISVSLEKLAKLKPERTEYMVLLAQTRERLNDREGAAQAYRTILQTKPDEPNALAGFTSLLLKENRPEAAVGLLQASIQKAEQLNQAEPGSAKVGVIKLILGDAYLAQKRYPEAVKTFDEVIAADAQDFRPVFGKARVLASQGKKPEAKKLMDAAYKLAPATYKDAIKGEISKLTPATSSSSATPAPGQAAPVSPTFSKPATAPTPPVAPPGSPQPAPAPSP
jgi:Tfp pilus assembly protein PilF